MSARRRKRGGHEEEEENVERWTVSYMDMVTVMMCLFIVLFAISQVDQVKFQQLASSLAASFGDSTPTVPAVTDGSSGIMDADDVTISPPEPDPISGGAMPQDLDAGALRAAAEAEALSLDQLRQRMAADLDAHGLGSEVRFSITERGLVIGLVTQNTFFSPASAHMTDTTLQVVDTIAATLQTVPNDVLLEGHANTLPETGKYETNWEISADRATKVLRRMVEHDGIAPNRVRAVAYGDAYPVADGPDALDLNRRVDVVVVSDQPEPVRNLLPEVAETLEGA